MSHPLKPFLKNLANGLIFYFGWFIAVLGAEAGHAHTATAAVLALVVVQLSFNHFQRAEWYFLVVCGFFGFFTDTLLAIGGAIQFPPPAMFSWIAPIWVVALWMNLGATINGCLSWMNNRPILAGLSGVISGPLTYFAGTKFGVIEFHPHRVVSFIALAVVWAAVMPALFRINHALRSATPGKQVPQWSADAA